MRSIMISCGRLCHNHCNWAVKSSVFQNGCKCFIRTSQTCSIGERSDDLVFTLLTALNGRRLLIPASSSRPRMVSLDTTRRLEGGKWHQTDSSDVVVENVG
ncbi:hypothetical protein TNCV_2576011 [Trichonephila clavipes]|uniref:Uncharacterized protein n=1 Tax=Trichonephila clavipes TaxID=2585209 RepID=A0A8X6RA49_TRICX|nr:hypothetical protein TNCV_2576011 [Trichonephila clavipes]